MIPRSLFPKAELCTRRNSGVDTLPVIVGGGQFVIPFGTRPAPVGGGMAINTEDDGGGIQEKRGQEVR